MISLVEKQSIESIDSPQTPKQEVKLKCYKTELKSVNFM